MVLTYDLLEDRRIGDVIIKTQLIQCNGMLFAARIILDAERFTPSVVLFNNLNWLPFTEQSLIKRCALVYKRVHNYIMPSYLNNLLVRNSEIHNRATRHSNINRMCPKCKRKSEGGRTFTIRTIKDWNCMNANIRNNGSLASFKHIAF